MAGTAANVKRSTLPPELAFSAPPTPNNPLTNQYKLYNSAVGQQAEDYGGIMQGYKNLTTTATNRTNNIPQVSTQSYTPQTYRPQTITPTQFNYQPSAQVGQSIGNLGELSKTGGYSGQDIADLRARGISPIRSVYANAEQDVDRQRALQGGFSPNYNAVKAKMAREMSEQIGQQVSNVNAGIAEKVAQNKIGLAPHYAAAAKAESDTANQYGKSNADTLNQSGIFNANATNTAGQFNAGATNTGNQFNIQNASDVARLNEALRSGNTAQALAALGGQSSLYGTTPALSSLFGNQAMQGAQFQNQVQQQQNQPGLNVIAQLMQGYR